MKSISQFSYFSFLMLVILIITALPLSIFGQDSTKTDKIKVTVQVANQQNMEPMPAIVQAKVGATGHVVAIAKGNMEEGYVLQLPVGALYLVETRAEGFRISLKEVNLLKKPKEQEITLNVLLGTSGGYVTPDDINAPATLISSIYFEKRAVDLDSTAFSELKRIYIILRKNPTIRLSLRGHSDNPGTIYQNIEISEWRARQIRAILISRGIAPYRLTYYGFGNIQPVSGNPEEKYLNNRVDFHLIL
ncbi:MAG: OmpA family protein [Bacteroidota bacterium]